MSTIINGTSSAITFPDSSVQNTSAIVSGYVPYANLPAGSVLQVVQGSFSSGFTTSSSSLVSTGFTVSITPKFATSKILVLGASPCGIPTGTANAGWSIALYRNGSALYSPLGYQNYLGGGANNSQRWVCPINYLDSPATTSAVSYTLYLASYNGLTSAYMNETGSTYITVMEIAG